MSEVFESYSSNCAYIWLPGIVQLLSTFLTKNEVTCTLRLVNKATWLQFGQHTLVKLSRTCPEHAFTTKWGVAGALHELTYVERRKLLALTAATGSIPNLKVALRAIAATLTDEVLQPDAAAPGQLCPWLRDRGCWWLAEVLAAAAGAGQWGMCEWLLACGCPCDAEAVYAAARGGHLGLMERLFAQLPGLRSDVEVEALLAAVAEGCVLGDLQRVCTEWTQELQLSDENKDHILAAAAGSPTPDWQAKVEWLEAQGCSRTSHDPGVKASAASDAVSRLIWLRGRGYPVSELTAVTAALAGNASALEYLLGEAGVQLDSYSRSLVVWSAAGAGSVAVLQVLHAKCHLDASNPYYTLLLVLQDGHLSAAAWLLETLHMPTQKLQRLMEFAMRSGSLELVRLMLGRGCQLERGLVSAAAESGCGELLEWLVVEQGCPMDVNGEPYSTAIKVKDVAMLRLLRRLNVPMEAGDVVYSKAAAVSPFWGLSMLRCLHDQLHYPWSPNEETFNKWIKWRCSLQSLQWLVEEAGCPVDWQEAVQAAEDTMGVGEDVKQWLRAGQERRGQQK